MPSPFIIQVRDTYSANETVKPVELAEVWHVKKKNHNQNYN